jgi:hypothetical protein
MQDGFNVVFIQFKQRAKKILATARRSAVQVACRVPNQTATGPFSISRFTEVVQHGFFAGGVQFEH